MNTVIKKNAATLSRELKWLEQVIETRMNLYAGHPGAHADIFEINPPDLLEDDSFYAEVVKRDEMSFTERIILLIALVPHIKPELFDPFLMPNKQTDRQFTEFGGDNHLLHSGFIPTGETAAFILTGGNLEKRLRLFALFCDDHFFHTRNILKMEKSDPLAPYLSGTLKMSLEYLSYFTIGISKFTSPAT